MADHAGFAAALTVRERVLKVALQAAYSNGSFPKVLAVELRGEPPVIKSNLFVDAPKIECDGGSNLFVLTLQTWGTLTVTQDVDHVVQLIGELEVTISPLFMPGAILKLDPLESVVNVRRWTATVTSEDTPPDLKSYVEGEELRIRLEESIRLAIVFGVIKLPSIDASFLGPVARFASSVKTRIRPGVLLLGLNVENDDYAIVGSENALVDFALGNDIAGVVNPMATILLLDDLRERMIEGVEDSDASLDRLDVQPASGYFQVSGAASKSSATVNFSFRLVPGMFHIRPGKFFTYLQKPRRVNQRVWPALKFNITEVHTDVDRSWWVLVLEILGSIITVGFVALIVEDLMKSAGESFSGSLKAARTGAPAARIRRTIPPPGGVSVRIGLDQFDVTAAGTYIGISVRATASPMALLGPVTVPQTYINDVLRYIVKLPSGVSTKDPALVIKWTLEDRSNNVMLIETDGPAAAKLKFEFSPSAFPGVSNFRIVAQMYRELGVDIYELGLSSLNIQLREALPPKTYVRWLSQVKNPQVTVDEATDTWNYHGEVRVSRWSEWHRTDFPCRAVNAPNRFRYNQETADRLPFDLHLLEGHRGGLCPYCFYGGPSGVNASL